MAVFEIPSGFRITTVSLCASDEADEYRQGPTTTVSLPAQAAPTPAVYVPPSPARDSSEAVLGAMILAAQEALEDATNERHRVVKELFDLLSAVNGGSCDLGVAFFRDVTNALVDQLTYWRTKANAP